MLVSARIDWPQLFVPRSFEEGGPEKYSVTLLIPKDDPVMTEIKKVIVGLIKDKLSGKNPDERNMVLKDGDQNENPAYHGHYAIKANSLNAPAVVDELLDPITDQGKIRAGDYVNVDVGFYAYNRKYKGIGCSLNSIQFASKGDAIGSAVRRVEDVFKKIPKALPDSSAAPEADYDDSFLK